MQYTDLQSQFRSSCYPFLGCCCYETEKFRANAYFETIEHSVQTADDNGKLPFFYISNLVAIAPGLNFGKKLSNLLTNRDALNYSSRHFVYCSPPT